jgi:hypothetical protein
MSTTQTPLETLFATFCDQTTTAELRVFFGVGLYFLLLLLACHDVESHPGPDLLSPLAALNLSMMGMKLKLNQINKKTITTEDLFPVIEECIKQIVEITMKIKAKFKFKRVFIL